MTTDEWIGRYNNAFAQAAFEQEFWDRRLRTPEPPPRYFPSLGAGHRVLYQGPRWTAPEDGAYALNGKVFVLKRGDPFPSNPSPFEPKEVVDDGLRGNMP